MWLPEALQDAPPEVVTPAGSEDKVERDALEAGDEMKEDKLDAEGTKPTQ